MSQNKQVQASFGVGSDYESECWNEHCNDLKVGCSTGEGTWEKTWRKAQEPLLAEIARLSGNGVLQHTAYIDDIAAIAHGEGYDAGAGCSRYDATQAWDNFKEHTLPVLKARQAVQAVPVGYVLVPVESAKFCANVALAKANGSIFANQPKHDEYRKHIDALLIPNGMTPIYE